MDITVTPTKLEGVVLIDTDFFRDERGFFIEVWHAERYREHGLPDAFVQDNHSRSAKKVLRGLHYQDMTAPMGKLVRCTAGAILDVCVDLRPDSPSYLRHAAVELSAANYRALYVPEGCAHGYQTLTDGAEVLYLISAPYAPDSAGGARFDDPAFGIRWPLPVTRINDRDRTYPDYVAP